MKKIHKLPFALLSVLIAGFVVLQIPENSFSINYADIGKKNNLIYSVCDNNGKDNDYLDDELFNPKGTERYVIKDYVVEYCRAYFSAYLRNSTVTTDDVDPDDYIGYIHSPFSYSKERINDNDIKVELDNEQIDRVQEHVKWWGNAAKQSERGDQGWYFLKEYCNGPNTVDSETVVNIGYVQGTSVRNFDCAYEDNTQMTNAFCSVVSSSTSAGEYTSGSDTITCYSSESMRDRVSSNVIGDNNNPTTNDNDECVRGHRLGWAICPMAQGITDAVNFLIDNLLLPMLQWRILV